VGPANVLTGADLGPYVLEGRTPEAAVFPGTVEEVRTVLELASTAGVPMIPWGGGTASAVGTPAARAGLVLGLRRLTRLIEHEPGDLTVTAEAGLTVAALQAALGGRGQWLSLDPPEAERATLGGVIATNAAGPRRQLYGTARDLLIGVTVVTGEGAVVRGGGKVVKNVAGYDLPKLFVGSYGTLGVIVEATLKVRPRPEHEQLVAVTFDRLKDAGAGARAILTSDLIPTTLDVLDAEASRALGLAAMPTLAVGFDGLAEQVAWQAEELRRVAGPAGGHSAVSLEPAVWARLATAARGAFPTPAALVRLAVLPTAVTETMEHGAGAARQRGLLTAWTAHAGVGVLTAALFSTREHPDPAPIADVLGEWRGIARTGGGHAVIEWAPLPIKAQVPVWDDAGPAGRVMQRIKTQLDPRNILNPGRFVAGI
jgi:glycolate dehydrogenase FAD-binding subunit